MKLVLKSGDKLRVCDGIYVPEEDSYQTDIIMRDDGPRYVEWSGKNCFWGYGKLLKSGDGTVYLYPLSFDQYKDFQDFQNEIRN